MACRLCLCINRSLFVFQQVSFVLVMLKGMLGYNLDNVDAHLERLRCRFLEKEEEREQEEDTGAGTGAGGAGVGVVKSRRK